MTTSVSTFDRQKPKSTGKVKDGRINLISTYPLLGAILSKLAGQMLMGGGISIVWLNSARVVPSRCATASLSLPHCWGPPANARLWSCTLRILNFSWPFSVILQGCFTLDLHCRPDSNASLILLFRPQVAITDKPFRTPPIYFGN